jgi:hypothetical protein
VSLVDVHGLGGGAMVEAAVGALPAMGTRLLAITILTSHDEETLDEIGLNGTMLDSVRRLAVLAKEAGADGVVASPHEVALIRETCGSDFLIVTPGIRPVGAATGDQARAATPRAALAAGADYLVVGRPITEAPDPAAAVLEAAKATREAATLYEQASRAYAAEQWEPAAEYARRAVALAPAGDTRRAELLCVRGEALLRAGHAREAVEAFAVVVEVGGAHLAQALHSGAMAREASGDAEGAAAWRRRLGAEFPETPWARPRS